MMTDAPKKYYIGWDVGGWNCERNSKSRDAIVILSSELNSVCGEYRGNIRDVINQHDSTEAFMRGIFTISGANHKIDNSHVVMAIDATLGFPSGFLGLLSGHEAGKIEGASIENPYLYRTTERILRNILREKDGRQPLSALKDMIGSQATKAMHVLRKFAFRRESCGVWRHGHFTIIESYPAACRNSPLIKSLQNELEHASWAEKERQDKKDALTCALVARLFDQQRAKLTPPSADIPEEEGWIWVPTDALKGND